MSDVTIPASSDSPIASQSELLLSARNLSVNFRVARGGWPWQKATLRAVNDVSFDIRRGETLGLVGESGCGKSTLARALIGLAPVEAGSVRWRGEETVTGAHRRLDTLRRDAQMIFQDPLASLDPRMSIGEIVAEPLRTHAPHLGRAEIERRVLTMLERVGLNAQHAARRAHEFSGGQCQRVGIARALIGEPGLVICDEPVSALDVSIQAQIVNLLRDLQRERSLSLLFVAHDLAVVKTISHRVMVMYLGRVMEIGDCRAIYDGARHPYTRALLDAVPVPDPALARARRTAPLGGEIPSPLDPPSGCAFRTRCTRATDNCAVRVPPLLRGEAGQPLAACWHPHGGSVSPVA
ncbi:oligopeptide transport system ATP-binding protein [Paraburkholderia bannensis]|uniref:Oligopeptide transport system ATP-binding protein n=1 Tax=Paraburkholderia bannensis TaxID=765414 RepID=A0A7W9U2F5_9BURK|nr:MULTISPECIES: oligopeptide/dipeptide ABC transporter ATP-binding protein [Paraburkholderia]MBB3260867.1 oligopeptide transport system ATP-binding protein [Paraburkholderia sp. WP4_3_2]MBB6105772.1 oligopeptide transport system ATP-binding protein [Paraburkholderia bannensis]